MILVTWRLRGSLLQKPRCASAAAVDRLLDNAAGESLLLGEAHYAGIVRDTLIAGDRELSLYTLRAWVIQHNHVHVLMYPNVGTVRIAKTVMGATERAAGRVIWERESYERPVLGQQESEKAVEFIEHHPVRLGIVKRASDWEWSSAFVDSVRERNVAIERLQVSFKSLCERAAAGGA
jgi:REP element-mobilizing transposase RayT